MTMGFTKHLSCISASQLQPGAPGSVWKLLVLMWLHWLAGVIAGSDVSQTPVLVQHQGEDATIRCSHTKGASYFHIYWFRQLPGKTMELIVFTATGIREHDFGTFNQSKYSATKTVADSGTFSVKKLVPHDQGVYFCAVSTVPQIRGRPAQKPLMVTAADKIQRSLSPHMFFYTHINDCKQDV